MMHISCAFVPQPMLFAAFVLVSVASATAGDYFPLPGRWLGDDRSLKSGTAPSNTSRVYLPLDVDFSADGFIADDIMLQICDRRDDCDMVYQHPVHTSRGGPDSLIEFLKRSDGHTSFVHRSRCDGPRDARTVTAPRSGGTYKACDGSWDYPQPVATLRATQPQCADACNLHANCTMFTTDGATGCWLARFNSWDGGTLFVKIPETSSAGHI